MHNIPEYLLTYEDQAEARKPPIAFVIHLHHTNGSYCEYQELKEMIQEDSQTFRWMLREGIGEFENPDRRCTYSIYR